MDIIAADAGARRFQRSWSRDEKRRILDETFHSGAAVADVTRRHGLNANLVLNSHKASWAAGGPNVSAEQGNAYILLG